MPSRQHSKAYRTLNLLVYNNHLKFACRARQQSNGEVPRTIFLNTIEIRVIPGKRAYGFIRSSQNFKRDIYNTIAASYGLQAGLQKFGYALFFMTDSALKWIDRSDGWEIGVGPSIVVVDAGAAASMTSTTLQSDIYAFFFDQKGLMAGIGLQGTKINRLEK